MKKLLILVLAVLLLAGCIPTQESCIEQDLFFYRDACVEWSEIPVEDQEEVIYGFAVHLAEENDITIDESLYLISLSLDALYE